MDTLSVQKELDILIQNLEQKQQEQWEHLQASFSEVSDQFQPINIVKNSLKEIKIEKFISEKLLTGLFGLGMGYLADRYLKEETHKKFKIILAGLVQAEITAEEKSKTETIHLYTKIALNIIAQLTSKKPNEFTP